MGAGSVTEVVGLPGRQAASYEIIGSGRPALMFAGGPGFSASYMNGDAELLSDVLTSYLIDPHGSGSSTPPADTAGYSPEGHARFYEEVRQALALPKVVVLGHSFGATTALTYAALYPESTAGCVAVAAFGIGPDADAQDGGEAEAEALLLRHVGSPWYEAARPVMDQWTERLLAATDPAQMEQMMATVLPFYLAEPDKPEVATRLAGMSRVMKANLAAGQAWEGGLYQSADLRPLLGRITCPTLIVAGELDFICGPAQAQPIASAVTGSQLVMLPGCGHIPSIEAPHEYRMNTVTQSWDSSAADRHGNSAPFSPPRASSASRCRLAVLTIAEAASGHAAVRACTGSGPPCRTMWPEIAIWPQGVAGTPADSRAEPPAGVPASPAGFDAPAGQCRRSRSTHPGPGAAGCHRLP
jgi:proline iminopeptidase